MNIKGRLKIGAEAKPRKRQHTSPCSDCPFARKSVKGWLGRWNAEDFIAAAHGEAKFDCHTVSNQQCAGSAIYRSNVCKETRREDVIRLPGNTISVFASPLEFRAHHFGFTPPQSSRKEQK